MVNLCFTPVKVCTWEKKFTLRFGSNLGLQNLSITNYSSNEWAVEAKLTKHVINLTHWSAISGYFYTCTCNPQLSLQKEKTEIEFTTFPVITSLGQK